MSSPNDASAVALLRSALQDAPSVLECGDSVAIAQLFKKLNARGTVEALVDAIADGYRGDARAQAGLQALESFIDKSNPFFDMLKDASDLSRKELLGVVVYDPGNDEESLSKYDDSGVTTPASPMDESSDSGLPDLHTFSKHVSLLPLIILAHY